MKASADQLLYVEMYSSAVRSLIRVAFVRVKRMYCFSWTRTPL